ncbi:MAG: hypothetical protein RJA70_1508 [Pseudomonadota bacterium]|jgi:formylglycine-generating enzyme required for sulfatase activity
MSKRARGSLCVAALIISGCSEKLIELLPLASVPCTGPGCEASPPPPSSSATSKPVNTAPVEFPDAGDPDDGQPETDADPPPPRMDAGGRPEAASCEQALLCAQGRSCCETRMIPGGPFEMGRGLPGPGSSDAWSLGEASELPEREVIVGAFSMDTFEVTVGRFRPFAASYRAWVDSGGLAVGSGAHPLVAASGWQAEWDDLLAQDPVGFSGCARTWTPEPGLNEDVPINCVTWYEAFAFCAWDGARLPTEAEWEFAAAGGTEDRLFAWGPEQPDPTKRPTTVVPVGAQPFPGSRFGVEDLSGNVWEWTRDSFEADWYREGGAECSNCINLENRRGKTRRGGSFASVGSESWRSANRTIADSEIRQQDTGIRCVRDL